MKEIPITSFDNLQIGQAENAAAGTGCTVVLLGKDGAPAGLDVRGGGPASRESELLKPLAAAQVIHAIVLAGGSAFGLNAAGGVMRYLEERGIGFDVGVTKVPLVCQSDLFDLTVADARARPDAAMAYAACVNAETGNYRDGNHGAGYVKSALPRHRKGGFHIRPGTVPLPQVGVKTALHPPQNRGIIVPESQQGRTTTRYAKIGRTNQNAGGLLCGGL